MTFNHWVTGSSPVDLINMYNYKYKIFLKGHRLMVDLLFSKQFVSIRIRLALIPLLADNPFFLFLTICMRLTSPKIVKRAISKSGGRLFLIKKLAERS